jgi:hypothetical protein
MKVLVAVLAVLIALVTLAVHRIQLHNESIDQIDLFSRVPPWPVYTALNWWTQFVESTIPYYTIPPVIQMFKNNLSYHVSRSIAAVAKYNVADHIGHEEMSTQQIAEKEGIDADMLCRVLKFLETKGIFAQVPQKKCTFRNNRMSSYLLESHVNSVKFMAKEQLIEYKLFDNIDEIIRTGVTESYRTAISSAWGTDDARINFGKFMSKVTVMSIASIVEEFDFTPYKSMIDIGGSVGQVLSRVLERYPNMTGVLFDIPQVVQDAKQEWSQDHNLERISFVGGDFFESIPSLDPITMKPIDLYFMKMILHDWSDQDAIKILKQVRSAMSINATLVIAEASLHEGHHVGNRHSDIVMTVIGGKERDTEQFNELFSASGLKLERVIHLRSPLMLTVARPM